MTGEALADALAVIARSDSDAATPMIVCDFQWIAAPALGLDPRVPIAPRNDKVGPRTR
jgi:hypothetical protein